MQEGSRIAIFAPAIKDPQVVKVSFSTILYVLLFLIETEKNIDIMRGHRKAKQSYHKQCTPLLSQSRIQLMHQRSCCLECLNHAASVSYYLHLDNHAPAAFSLWRRKPITMWLCDECIHTSDLEKSWTYGYRSCIYQRLRRPDLAGGILLTSHCHA